MILFYSYMGHGGDEKEFVLVYENFQVVWSMWSENCRKGRIYVR